MKNSDHGTPLAFAESITVAKTTFRVHREYSPHRTLEQAYCDCVRKSLCRAPKARSE